MEFTADLDHSQQQNNIDLDPDHTIFNYLPTIAVRNKYTGYYGTYWFIL
jgi:hypothetical protein